MDQLAILNEITAWHWLVLGLLLVGLEMLAPGAIFMWLGIAAGITGIAFLALPALGWELQFLIFAVLSIVTVFVGRNWVKRHPTKSEQPNLNVRGAQYIGRTFTLDKPIENGFGIIVVDDTRWKITGPDLAAGNKVKVTALDGQVLQVETAEG